MSRIALFGAWALAGLFQVSAAAAWTEESPEIGSLAAGAGEANLPRKYGLESELEVLGTAQTFADDDLDLTYGLLGGGGLGLSVRSGRDTRFVMRLQYLRSKGDPYYDQPSFDAGTPATVQVVPLSMGVRHDLAPNSHVRVNVGMSVGIDWIREELPDPEDPTRSLAHDGAGWGLQFSVGPEYRTGDDRRGVGFELAFARHQAELSGTGYGGHDLNRSGFHGSAYLVFALGARNGGGEVAP